MVSTTATTDLVSCNLPHNSLSILCSYRLLLFRNDVRTMRVPLLLQLKWGTMKEKNWDIIKSDITAKNSLEEPENELEPTHLVADSGAWLQALPISYLAYGGAVSSVEEDTIDMLYRMILFTIPCLQPKFPQDWNYLASPNMMARDQMTLL